MPYIGWALAGFVEFFWPQSGEDVWDQIKEQVEELIDQELADFEYKQVKADLDGLEGPLRDYTSAVQQPNPDRTNVVATFDVAKGLFENRSPDFMIEGYEVLLLPLLSQMATMHLSLLREGVLHGKDWGLTDQDVAGYSWELTQQVDRYVSWCETWYYEGLAHLQLPHEGRNLPTLQWNARNAYTRSMTLTVLDSAFYWPYTDPTLYRAGSPMPRLTREIYADAQGNLNDAEPPLVDGVLRMPITGVAIWGGDRVEAVQVSYTDHTGPREGSDSGGANSPPHGWNGSVSADNPIVVGSGTSGDILDSVLLGFKDGEQTDTCGSDAGGAPFSWSFPAQVVSSIKVPGADAYYGSADCVIFGFRFEDGYPCPPVPGGHHFYTLNLGEVGATRGCYEGVAGWAPLDGAPGTVPLYRLYLGPRVDHFYTTSEEEAQQAQDRFGYNAEGIACQVFPAPAEGTVPLWRLYNQKTGDHFYTTLEREIDVFTTYRGYVEEQIACHLYRGASAPGAPGLAAPLYRMVI